MRGTVHITAQGPRLRNDLYCVEWDVKLLQYHTIANYAQLLNRKQIARLSQLRFRHGTDSLDDNHQCIIPHPLGAERYLCLDTDTAPLPKGG